jgi:hypothetical protein
LQLPHHFATVPQKRRRWCEAIKIMQARLDNDGGVANEP